jgi:hypothetical protein
MLEQQPDERVAPLFRPAVTCAGLADCALHDVATGKSTTAKGAPEALRPGVVETKQLDHARPVWSPYSTWPAVLSSTQCRHHESKVASLKALVHSALSKAHGAPHLHVIWLHVGSAKRIPHLLESNRLDTLGTSRTGRIKHPNGDTPSRR